MKDKREKQRIEARFSPYGKSPNSSRRQNSSPREQQHGNFSGPSLPKSRLMTRTPIGGSQRSTSSVSTAASTSTSSSPTVISLDDTPDEVVIDNIEPPEHSLPLACPVLYCEVLFTMREKLEKHKRDFDHCPINPCMVNLDGVLAHSRSYLCMSCGECFKVSKLVHVYCMVTCTMCFQCMLHKHVDVEFLCTLDKEKKDIYCKLTSFHIPKNFQRFARRLLLSIKFLLMSYIC